MARGADIKKIKEPTTEDIAKQLDALKSDMKELSDTLAALGKAKGEELSNEAKAKANAAVAKGNEELERLRGHAQTLNDDAREYVNKNPATSLGIAAAVGFAVGLLTSRR
ncbi:YqjD family protein [Falsihalocynthiibacter sp. SS001]|uniref:DUF883 family protein n=1 Tax=Falsihalocynthiibacter sp. SS001 TaxID=3349698 RepID=UPI0036D3F846